jgi:hypothetical protein
VTIALQIRGGNISITAAAEDKNVYDEAGDYGQAFLKNLFDVLGQIPGLLISRITGVMGQVVVHDANATVSVWRSNIVGSGSVTVGSSAKADASPTRSPSAARLPAAVSPWPSDMVRHSRRPPRP